jgi:hypothetical protein
MSAPDANGWRDIEDCAPDGRTVLFYLRSSVASPQNMRLGYRTPAGFFGVGGQDRKLAIISHWQPLPGTPVA